MGRLVLARCVSSDILVIGSVCGHVGNLLEAGSSCAEISLAYPDLFGKMLVLWARIFWGGVVWLLHRCWRLALFIWRGVAAVATAVWRFIRPPLRAAWQMLLLTWRGMVKLISDGLVLVCIGV